MISWHIPSHCSQSNPQEAGTSEVTDQHHTLPNYRTTVVSLKPNEMSGMKGEIEMLVK